jgi:hypothetical protein
MKIYTDEIRFKNTVSRQRILIDDYWAQYVSVGTSVV